MSWDLESMVQCYKAKPGEWKWLLQNKFREIAWHLNRVAHQGDKLDYEEERQWNSEVMLN